MLILLLLYLFILAVSASEQDLCKKHQFKPICEGNLGFSRMEMPQLNTLVLNKYIEHYLIPNSIQLISTHMLVPIQKEMNWKSIVDIMRRYKPCSSSIIVGHYNGVDYIIDGHHRYAACRLVNGKINIIRLYRDPRQIIKELRDFEGVYHIDLSTTQNLNE